MRGGVDASVRPRDSAGLNGTLRSEGHAHIGPFSPLGAIFPERTPVLGHQAESGPRAGPSLVSSDPELFRRCIAESTQVCLVAAAPDGRLRAVNGALASRLGCAPPALSERDIWSLLVEADAEHLRLCALHGWLPAPEPLLLTFVGVGGLRFTLRCLVDVGADGLVIVGEPLCAAAGRP